MKFDDACIVAYIKDKLPDDAVRECDARMMSSPEFRMKVHQARAIYDLADNLKQQQEIDTDQAWRHVSRKLAVASFRTKVWNITRTAAAILLPLFLLHQYLIQPLLRTAFPVMITLTSAPGVVTKAVLPDGSSVWLNAQSELIYPQRFTGKERTVRLSGEAFFSVSADEKNRFKVEIPGNMTVSAVGTEFNVHAYREDSNYQVTLARGKVEVEAARSMRHETLAVGQKVVLTTQTGEMKIIQADTYMETAWKDGKMVFRREKLHTIAQKLSRRFGVIVRLEGEALQDDEYTATFTGETLEGVLDLLQRSAPITYSISRQEQRNNYTFTPRIVTIRSR